MAVPGSSSRQYNYKKPSSFNFVSFLLLVGVVAGAYWGWKFGPVYWTRFKVTEILQEGASEASGIRRMNEASQIQIEQKVLGSVTDQLAERGIGAENDLKVYFEDHYATLHADYDVTVRHPFGKRSVVKVRRTVSVAE